MATIFEKLPASGEKCLILDPKEALIYPFDIGEWTEMRMSFAISFTGPTDDNSVISSETVSSSTSALSSMLIGLYSGDNSLPFSNNTSFIGFGNRTGTSIYMSRSTVNVGAGVAAISINSSAIPASIGTRPLISGFSSLGGSYKENGYGDVLASTSVRNFTVGTTSADEPPFMTISGDANYAKIETLSFYINNKNQTGQNFDLNWYNNGATSSFTDVSIQNLSSLNSATSISKITGFYYNSDLSPTGSPISIPNKLLMHFPFLNNRARIHSILIEKYA